MSNKIFIFLLLFALSSQACHKNCEECYSPSDDDEDMECITCKEGFSKVLTTDNCVDKLEHPTYFLYLDYLCPCSILNTKCYECDPFLIDDNDDICLSCFPGFKYNDMTSACEPCNANEYPITMENFEGCMDPSSRNCELYITNCVPLLKEEHKKICEKNNNGNSANTCVISHINNQILFINWLKDGNENVVTPSYNNDKSDYLLIEITLDSNTFKSVKRKIFFYNQEGRGLLNEINDEYEKHVSSRKGYFRFISSSIALKTNISDEYKYLLNFENYNNNLELIDIKTGEIFIDNLLNLLWLSEYGALEVAERPTTQLIELNKKNQFLLATFIKRRKDNSIILAYYTFSLDESPEQKISTESLNLINEKILDLPFNQNGKFYFVETKGDHLYASFVLNGNELYIYNNQSNSKHYIYTLANDISFQKLLLIKDEIKFLSYYSWDGYLAFLIFDTFNSTTKNIILESMINKYLSYEDNNDYADVIFISEEKAVFVLQKSNSISILLLNFFNNYKNYIANEIIINIYGNEINNFNIYSLVFKYRNMVGLQFKNTNETGFILLGYYNSTDPKQILNIKKDGLNYNIILANYINLQSNVFEYEIKCVRIIDIPNLHESGIYLVSNITKNFIQKNDCIDINTNISLYFAYNGTIKKDNYLFKFVGVVQEPKYEVIEKISIQTFSNIYDNAQKEKYIEEYNERRNKDITGRVALVQINVLNDTKVFCDKKYDKYALKTNEGKLIACGEGTFYDVENVNEITLLNLGMNYYFDYNKNAYIKCHERCKTCSREFNDTNMNCDTCIDNFFIRDDNCLEISKCDYNYYYDENLDLKCINRDTYCPDFKPYENAFTKECIQNCSINEFNNVCNPTNNKISIEDTYRKIFDNIEQIKLKELLFTNKEKYMIYGNNVTFIFSTSEIEKNELYYNSNTSSIILGDFENYFKQYYSLKNELPIPILKIETLNNHSDDIELHYEFFNSSNLYKKLDFNITSKSFIEIRLPKNLKPYKMDLILKTRDSGYNIFDLNDSFFNDICSVFTYNNTDFSLSERKTLIDLSDEVLCLNRCNYSNYDIKTLRTICLCKIGFDENDKTSENQNANNKNGDDNLVSLIKTNMDFSKSSNFKVVKCTSIIFRKNLFLENYGFYITFLLFVANILTLVFSPISKVEKQFQKFCNEVLEKMKVIYVNNNENVENKIIIVNNDNKNENNNIKGNKIKGKKTLNKSLDIIPHIKIDDDKKIKKIKASKPRRSIMNKPIIKNLIDTDSAKEGKSDHSLNNSKIDKSNIELDKDKDSKDSKDEEEIIKKLKEQKNSDFYVYYVIKNIELEKRKTYLSESEIEGLSYKYAMEIEDRNKSNCYFDLLKEKNKIISIFLNDQDYNLQSIKISTFLFDFTLSLTINALFYNDQAIYEINQQKEENSSNTQFSRIIYSAIISGVIGFIIQLFALSHKSIIELRNYKEISEVEAEIPKLIQKLKAKYVIYYAMTILLGILFFYYITAFCAIYLIIQINMISDSAFSFLLTMSYSIILSLISAIIRIFSVHKKSKFRHFLYFISWVISLI